MKIVGIILLACLFAFSEARPGKHYKIQIMHLIQNLYLVTLHPLIDTISPVGWHKNKIEKYFLVFEKEPGR